MEIWDLYDDSMPELLISYLSYMTDTRNSSDGTIKGYKSDLKLFLKFIKKLKTKSKDNLDDINISDIDAEFLGKIKLSEMHMFLAYVRKERQNEASTRSRKVSAIQSFFKYLELKERVISENLARELDRPKLPKRNPIYLTLDESEQLLNSIGGRNKERDFCIITIFLNCGVRLSELLGINLSNIKNDTLTVVGKGNKERTIYLSEACLAAIHDYLEVRIKPKVPEDKDALFISSQGKRISKKAVENIVKKFVQKAEIENIKITPHKLRHTSATLLYKHGKVDIRVLQKLLGHESISTTEIYTHVDNEQLRDAVKTNPLANFTKK